MAVIDEFPGVEVTIEVAGQKATEYRAEHLRHEHGKDGLPSSNVYIESITDAIFSISVSATKESRALFKKTRSNAALHFKVFVDGKWARSKLLRLDVLPYSSSVTGSKARSDDPTMYELRVFKFHSVTKVDDACSARVEMEKKSAEQLGLIRVKLERCLEAPRVRKKSTSYSLKRVGDSPLELSEKSLKGREISHGIGSTSGGHFKKRSCAVLYQNKTLGNYYFHYRSRDALKSELVIPRSPSPAALAASPSPTPAPTANLDTVKSLPRDQLLRLAQERLAMGGVVVKEENKRGIKRERSPTPSRRRAYKVVKTEDGGTAIDLTED